MKDTKASIYGSLLLMGLDNVAAADLTSELMAKTHSHVDVAFALKAVGRAVTDSFAENAREEELVTNMGVDLEVFDELENGEDGDPLDKLLMAEALNAGLETLEEEENGND